MATIERRPNIVGLLIVLFAVVGGGVVWAATRSSSEGPAAPSSVASTSSATSTRAAPLTSPSTTVAQASVVDLQLPSPSGVVLFAHTAAPNAVLRIDIDQHRVVSTPVGPVMSTAPAFLAVGPSAAVIRPYDNVPGYVVADSGAVTDPPGRLDDGTFMVCSDGRSNRLWVADESLLQVDFNGSLQAQIGGAQRPWAIGCDGAGEMLFQQGGATKVTGIEAPTLVTSNNLIAAGPRTFLVRECATATACPLTVVDRATGERRSLTLDVAITDPQSLLPETERRLGSISPDGRTAVLFRALRETLFVDLMSGLTQTITSFGGEFQSFAWSTDSRYVFYIGATHNLMVFDRQTRDRKALGFANILALASRPS